MGVQTSSLIINKQDFIKLKKKKICPEKDTLTPVKRRPTEWENKHNNLISEVSYGGLVSRIYDELKILNKKKKQII